MSAPDDAAEDDPFASIFAAPIFAAPPSEQFMLHLADSEKPVEGLPASLPSAQSVPVQVQVTEEEQACKFPMPNLGGRHYQAQELPAGGTLSFSVTAPSDGSEWQRKNPFWTLRRLCKMPRSS